jgi:hypothetical protein
MSYPRLSGASPGFTPCLVHPLGPFAGGGLALSSDSAGEPGGRLIIHPAPPLSPAERMVAAEVRQAGMARNARRMCDIGSGRVGIAGSTSTPWGTCPRDLQAHVVIFPSRNAGADGLHRAGDKDGPARLQAVRGGTPRRCGRVAMAPSQSRTPSSRARREGWLIACNILPATVFPAVCPSMHGQRSERRERGAPRRYGVTAQQAPRIGQMAPLTGDTCTVFGRRPRDTFTPVSDGNHQRLSLGSEKHAVEEALPGLTWEENL